jgi:DNA-binding CsgD family transcriptional regulator
MEKPATSKALLPPAALPVMVGGFGLAWAAVFVFAYGFIFSPSLAADNPQQSYLGLGFLAGIVCSEALMRLRARPLSTHPMRRRLAAGALACLFAMGVGMVTSYQLEVPVAPMLILALLAGIWEGAFHILWGEAFARIDSSHSTRYLYASVVVGALIFILITLSTSGTSEIIMTLLAATFSFICLMLTLSLLKWEAPQPWGKAPAGRAPRTPGKQREARKAPVALKGKAGQGRRRGRPSGQSQVPLVLFAAYGAVFGYALSSNIQATSDVWSTLAIGIALAGGVAVLLVVEISSRRAITFIDIARFLLPLIAVELVPIPFVDEQQRWLLCLLLTMTITMFDTASFSYLGALAQQTGQGSIRILSQGRLCIQLGMLSGSAANFVLADMLEPTAQYALYFPSVLVVLLFFAVAVGGNLGAVGYGEAIDSAPPDYGDAACDKTDDMPDIDLSGKGAAQRYGLSVREADVLKLLLTGRSAPAIASGLNLSLSTVKTHISHIYKKVGVNSRDRLLEVLEGRD